MNLTIEEILATEAGLQKHLTEAKETYRRESNALREQVGAMLRSIRETSPLNATQMGVILGVKSPRATMPQMEVGIPNPDGSRRWHSLETMASFLPRYKEAVETVNKLRSPK